MRSGDKTIPPIVGVSLLLEYIWTGKVEWNDEMN